MRLSPVLSPLCAIISWDGLTEEQQNILVREIIGYILRIRTFAQVRKNLRFLKPRQILDCREKSIYDWNMAVVLRLAIYTCAKQCVQNMQEVINVFTQYHLLPEDAAVYFIMLIAGDLPAINQKVSLVKIPTIPELRRDCDSMVNSNDIKQFIGKLVNKKLRAFAHSNNYTLKDFENEFLAEAARCYYNAIPNLTGAHLISHIKKTVKHYGYDLISYYKAGRRARLIPCVDTESGFTNVLRDITGISDNLAHYDRHEVSEMCIDYRYLLSKYNDGKSHALQLMGLSDSPEFVKWWNQNHRRSQSTTADIFYQHTSPQEYFVTICEYIGMPLPAFDKWLEELR